MGITVDVIICVDVVGAEEYSANDTVVWLAVVIVVFNVIVEGIKVDVPICSEVVGVVNVDIVVLVSAFVDMNVLTIFVVNIEGFIVEVTTCSIVGDVDVLLWTMTGILGVSSTWLSGICINK